MKNTTKPKVVISCRPDKPFMIRFTSAVQALGVNDSVLARKSLMLGFDAATKAIAAEQRESAKKILKRTKRLSFDLPGFQPFGPLALG